MSRILVADDEPHILKLVSFTLKNRGHEVIEATDGARAVELARSQQPDLILLDVMMPVMNGYEAARRISEDPATGHIPVVMLSAKSQRTEICEGLEAGAREYICKPFTPKELADRVAELLAST